jgi:hypothetical protein
LGYGCGEAAVSDQRRYKATFCPWCDVALDLHPGPGEAGCDVAGLKADLLSAFVRIGSPGRWLR